MVGTSNWVPGAIDQSPSTQGKSKGGWETILEYSLGSLSMTWLT
jgi:altronate dehydratase